MDNYPPMSMAYPLAGLWCPRKLCQRAPRACHYRHNCKAMTQQEASAKQAQWEIDRKRREDLAEQEARGEELWRESRKRRIAIMLATYDLPIEDLETWVKDVQRGR